MAKQHYDQNNPNIAKKRTAVNQPGVGNNAKGSDLGDSVKTTKAAQNKDKKEGEVAKKIEDKTARIPSDIFLWSSLACMGVSLALKIMKQDKDALFVGQWASPILLMGIYNKIVKTQGSE